MVLHEQRVVPIRAVFFDMYGTLGAPDAEIVPPFLEFIEGLGFDHADALQIEAAVTSNKFDGQRHDEASRSELSYDRWLRGSIRDELLKHCDDNDVEMVTDILMSYYLGIESAMRPYPETLEVLRELREMNVKAFIASNWAWSVNEAVKAQGVTDLIDGVYCSAQLGVRKPHPMFFDAILQDVALSAHDVLFVGDTWHSDIQGALEAGILPVFVDRGAVSARRHEGVIKLRDLRAIPAIVRSRSAS